MILDGHGNETDSLEFEENASIMMDLNTEEIISGEIKCQLSLSTMDDIPISTIFSPALRLRNNTAYKVSCTLFDVKLLPGTYRLHLKLIVDGQSYEAPLGEVAVKTVKYTPQEDESAEQAFHSKLAHLRSYMHGQGLIYVPHNWTARAE
jgi:hypothetical protein